MTKKDKRNLYGGQYRLSKELADVINKHCKFFKPYAHDMSAFVDINHFDVSNILVNENIYKKELTKIAINANKGNTKDWNTKREKLLLDGIVKLGKKYNVKLKKPIRINAVGNIRIEVSQKRM